MVKISRSRIIRITNYSARTIREQVRVHSSTHTHTDTCIYVGVKEMAACSRDLY